MKPVVAAIVLLAVFNIGNKDSVRLLSSWPDSGPPVEFEITGLGNGYSSPVITSDRLYVTGETDSIGYVFAYDLKGNLVWKSTYGEEFTVSFQGSRAAPVVVGSLLYIASGIGGIHCFDAETGVLKWSVSFVKDFGGINPIFGYSAPPVIDGEKLFCSPSGEKNNIVALNRFTGNLIWSSPGKGEPAGYGAPLVIALPERKILVTSSEFNILGLDAATGELLWNYELAFKGDIPCNDPIFDGMNIYWIAGPGNGAVAVRPSPDGKEISVQWKNPQFDTSFGGFVQSGSFLYGCSDSGRKYISVNKQNGKIQGNLSFGIGATILADSLLIAYNQRGQAGLIRPDKNKLELISSFKIQGGTKEHFSHPVYSAGRLYIRHGDALIAFKISSE
jgi:outer membrane protein assembly factor BamB